MKITALSNSADALPTSFLFGVVDVGAPARRVRPEAEIDHHREQLFRDVVVRLEPGAVDVLDVLHAQIGALDVEFAGLADQLGDVGTLQRVAQRRAGGVSLRASAA